MGRPHRPAFPDPGGHAGSHTGEADEPSSDAGRKTEVRSTPADGHAVRAYDVAACAAWDPQARDASGERPLGKGRSAIVFSSFDATGRRVARKVFVGSTLASLVHYASFGANNPYVWCPSAIEEAEARRRILSVLVRWWLPSKLRIAEVLAVGWNEEFRANEMIAEFIDGRGASLHHPFSKPREAELQDLIDNVMAPLQCRLVEAGLDGAAWQAGLGNPVASSNFLLESGEGHSLRWAWIDIESGVPALFPANPITLFRFYLPRALRYRRPLFDDVNVTKLRAYLARHQERLIEDLGATSWHLLCDEVENLAWSQQRWRSMTRLDRSIEARLQRGDIGPEDAVWYRDRPLRWYARECLRGSLAAVRRARSWIARWLKPSRLYRLARGAAEFLSSARYRAEFARRYLARRIERWCSRRQICGRQAKALMADMRTGETQTYITDFGVHLSIKPVVKAATWGGLPYLYAIGAIDEWALAAGVALGGAIGRTLYTFARLIGTTVRGASRPWIAFFSGMLPGVGNAAFPLQLLYESRDAGTKIAKFIVYDVLAQLGERVPIWGGQDTLTEHRLNHIGDLLVRRRSG